MQSMYQNMTFLEMITYLDSSRLSPPISGATAAPPALSLTTTAGGQTSAGRETDTERKISKSLHMLPIIFPKSP